MMCHVCSNESDSTSLSTPPSKGRKRRRPANSTAMSNYAGDSQQLPADYSVPGAVADPRTPLLNLSTVRDRMDSLQQFLAESVNSHTLISTEQLNMVSSEISAAIHQIILNGAALLAFSQQPPPQYSPLTPSKPSDPPDLKPAAKISPPPNQPPRPPPCAAELNLIVEAKEDVDMDCNDIVEMDAVELLAEHVHFCEICGKGFKRDANLRMHMRAHGNQFKTAEALAKPDKLDNGNESSGAGRSTRFSCPFEGCNRNKKHSKFRPLKSVICVRNHFKRSHCPKIYSCNRCNKKSFSVVADLKSHSKHCGESRWKCSCGTSFSRKDKLFGHMALFEGHMPAVVGGGEEEEEKKGKDTAAAAMEEDAEDEMMGLKRGELDSGFFDGFLDGFGSMEGYSLQDILRSPIRGEEFCGFLQ